MYVTNLRCLKCKKEYPPQPLFDGCPHCKTETFASNLEVVYDYEKIAAKINKNTFKERINSMWKYYELLPVDIKQVVSLCEGGTPLLPIDTGPGLFYVKDETRNPTWSFKDRLCSAAVSKAKELKAHTVTIASTGNHGASTAAYAARGNMSCIIFTTVDVPFTMKVLMQMYNAKVVATITPKERWTFMNACIQKYHWYPTGNYTSPMVGSNVYGIEGYKTIAYELCEQLEWEPPDYVVMPVGYGDGITGVWKGFKEFFELEFIDSLPKMVAVEVIGPLTKALKNGLDYPEELDYKETIAFSIGTTITPYQSIHTIRESTGLATTVSDAEIINAQKTLGKKGLYTEPASAVAFAGVTSLIDEGKIGTNDKTVVVLTSSGLKDPVSAKRVLPDVPVVTPDTPLKKVLKETYNYDMH